MCQLWLYLCYRFDASIVNSFSLSIPHVSCHSVFSEDLKVYSDSVFPDNLWISRDIAFSTIPCVNPDSIFGIEFVHWSWIYLLYTFQTQLSLNIYWRFQGLQWVCFRWWFMDQPWRSVFANSMSQPWFYFCNWFDALVVNLGTLSIPYASCHLVFIDDFNVYTDSIFTDDLWITSDISFLTISCVSHDSIFAIDLMCQSWIHWRCRFYTSPVTQYSITIARSTPTKFLLTIYGSVVTSRFLQFHRQPWHYFCYWFVASVVNSLTLWISYVSCRSVLSDDFKVNSDSVFHWRFTNKPWDSILDNSMRQPWLYFFYRFVASVVNSFTLSIPYVNCHSVFIDEFEVYNDSIFIEDL